MDLESPKADVGEQSDCFKSPLYQAILTDDVEALFDLTKLGFDIDELENGLSPLHLSIVKNKTLAAKILISLGANIRLLNNDGQAAIHLAVMHDRVGLIDDLTPGGDEDRERFADISDKSGNTALHIAACINHVNAINVLMEKDAEFNELNHDGDAPLHLEVLQNHIEAVRALLELGADPDLLNADGNSALHLAVVTSNTNMIDPIMKEGVELDITNKAGHSALHLAILKENVELVRKLLKEGENDSLRNAEGKSALSMAVNQGSLDIIREIVENAE